MSKKLVVRVYHSYYGCESGCCGHTVEIADADGDAKHSEFTFSHPYTEDKGDIRKWAMELAEKEIGKNWPECIDSIDWDSLIVDGVTDNCNA